MTRILLLSCSKEVIIHDIPIFDNTDVKKVEAFIKNKEAEYGDIDRILISLGTVRVLDKTDGIPIPLQGAKR
jgi:hypothetical protein